MGGGTVPYILVMGAALAADLVTRMIFKHLERNLLLKIAF